MSKATSSDTVSIIQQGLITTSNYMTDFNKLIDGNPHKTLEDVVKEMESYCKGVSRETASLISEVKTLTMTAKDEYKHSTIKIDAWCGIASQLLNAYMNLFNEGIFSRLFNFNRSSRFDEEIAIAQRDILMQVLNDGFDEMNAALDTLKKSAERFDQAAGKLTELKNELVLESGSRWKRWRSKLIGSQIHILTASVGLIMTGQAVAVAVASIAVVGFEISSFPKFFNEMSSLKKMFADLAENVEDAKVDVDAIKKMFLEEMRIIQDLKAQIHATKFMLPHKVLRDEVMPFVIQLIHQCDQYRARHAKNF